MSPKRPNGFLYFTHPVPQAEEVSLLTYGVPRSGSTYVWQLAAAVVPTGVLKTHDYADWLENVPVLATLRDPRDCLLSYWRATEGGNAVNMSEADVAEALIMAEPWWETLRQYRKSNPPIVWLRYEQFIRQPGQIFDALTQLLQVTVSPQKRAALLRQFSMDANRTRAAKLQSFSDIDQYQIHGRHIAGGKVGDWKKAWSSSAKMLVCQKLGPLLRELGYDPEA